MTGARAAPGAGMRRRRGPARANMLGRWRSRALRAQASATKAEPLAPAKEGQPAGAALDHERWVLRRLFEPDTALCGYYERSYKTRLTSPSLIGEIFQFFPLYLRLLMGFCDVCARLRFCVLHVLFVRRCHVRE